MPEGLFVGAPIVIFSFNRPQYLGRLLASLRGQQGVAISEDAVHLMQDGGVSRFSGNVYAEEAEIQECVELFKSAFPKGRVHISADNIGIARNIRRGERFVFEALGAEVGYFFEDDLELGQNYLQVMEVLRKGLERLPGAGYFAAYGDHRRAVPGPEVSLMPMEHNWGYGLFRSAWSRIAEWMKPYDAIVDRGDYRYRSHFQVFKYYRSLKVATDKSSQDSAKTLACADLGIARVMTDACFAAYIGVDGQSFTAEKFESMGFDRTVLCTHANPRIPKPTPEWLGRMTEAARTEAQRFREVEFDAFLDSFSARNADPDRTLDADDFHALYWLLLNRSPEPKAVEGFVGRYSLRAARRSVLESREFRGNAGPWPQTPSAQKSAVPTEEKIQFAYKLLTGREAPAAVVAQLGQIADPLVIRQRLFASPPLFAAAPELRLAYEIGELRKARASGRIRLVIGAAGIALPGWTATNIGLLNLLKPETWRAWLDENSVEAMLAEHVWGHLDEAEGHVAAHTCFRFLAPGGRLRIAVPDALMPDPAYQENCKVGGRNDHKHLYDYRSLSAVLSAAGFAVRLLEYFDENGKLHLNDWSREDGHIGRSVKFDKRNQDGVIRFTSLIVDGIKPKPEETQRRPSTPQPGS